MALENRLRPTATLFRDPEFGHRNSFTGQVVGDPTGWTEWDFAIGTAMQAISDGTTEEGHLIWELEDATAFPEPIKRWNKARRAIDDITNAKNYKSSNGEYWITELRQRGVQPGNEQFQTRAEWIEKVQRQRENPDNIE